MHTFRVLFGGARQGCRRFGFAGEIKNRQQNRLAVGTKSCDPAVPPNIETASLPLPLIGCQHSQASNASFTSSATRHLSPQPSGAHIIGFGPCRHHTAADSLLVRHPFSSRQRFVKLFLCYHRIFPLSTVLRHLPQFLTIFLRLGAPRPYHNAMQLVPASAKDIPHTARPSFACRRSMCPPMSDMHRIPSLCVVHLRTYALRPRLHRLVPHACVPFMTGFNNDAYLMLLLSSVIFIFSYYPLPVHYSQRVYLFIRYGAFNIAPSTL